MVEKWFGIAASVDGSGAPILHHRKQAVCTEAQFNERISKAEQTAAWYLNDGPLSQLHSDCGHNCVKEFTKGPLFGV